ncbi:OLC1v1017300C1 [Oldenlandia corymbosa var. corymbosa]|uniref:Protein DETOXIFICATION n=1 Tax=Oldenlandia corymbosa var. corymbosa TaxID=529605 RepID=A0AAV1E939_OLDCO|nr:OLC1v1017300C1 [Oldenlandia corymbosa var. corymbosa]
MGTVGIDEELNHPLLHEVESSKLAEAAEEGLMIQNDEVEEEESSLKKRVWEESKKLWHIAGPSIFSRITSYGLNIVSQAFAGHLGDLELASISISNTVIVGFNFGLLLGMASALETLCGQAFGAKKYHMLGIYLQRSWIILFIACIALLPFYVYATPILKLLGQSDEVSEQSGLLALLFIPQHFSFAFQCTLQRFFQSQLKTGILAWVSLIVLIIHVFISWLFVSYLQLGVVGITITLDISWWILVLLLFGYAVLGGCPETWKGFSMQAFSGLGEFMKLSTASGIMLCVENWYYRILILMTGNLENATIAIGALSVCMSINGWEMMIPMAFFAATGVRVANELGAGNGEGAKFAAKVSVVQSLIIGIFFCGLIMVLQDKIALIFSSSAQVIEAVGDLSYLLAITILLNSVQPVLSGVALGSGWQSCVAYINLACYYLVGLPSGVALGYFFHYGVEGIWGGMIFGGTAVQTVILAILTVTCDWEKEAKKAASKQKEIVCQSILTIPYRILTISSEIFTIISIDSRKMDENLEHQLLQGDLNNNHEEEDLKTTVLIETNKLWQVAGPAIVTRLTNCTLSIITQAIAGHFGAVELASMSIAYNVIVAFNFVFLLGMATALETLCGQAYGAKRYNMLGIYLQRSCIVLGLASILLLPIYVYATPILKLLGQPEDVAELTGLISICFIPMHLAFPFISAVQRFLMTQLKINVVAVNSTLSLMIHVFISWVLVFKLELGIFGAAAALVISTWVSFIGLFLYVICGGCPLTWNGFSIEAFSGLGEFLKLSAASGIMICLEFWYYRILLVMTGNLKNATIAVDALSVCMNINVWESMIPLAFLAATGVRVSNELGAGNAKGAKYAAKVALVQSSIIGIVFCVIVLIFNKKLALIFSTSPDVINEVDKLTYLLALTILLNSIQPVLSGVAIGSGWQSIVAYVNLGCYYLIGVPLGLVMDWVYDFGVQGIWCSMIFGGTAIQTGLLAIITIRRDWEKEAKQAIARHNGSIND